MFVDPDKGSAAPKPAPVAGTTGGSSSSGGGSASSGGGDGGGGSQTGSAPSYSGATPDIATILGSSPGYQQLLAFDTATSGEDLATMNARIAKMTGYYGNDNDPLSILGRINQAYKDRNMYIANTLTGHGMINSGETGWQGARSTLSYQQQELDARMKLQDFIDGLNDAFKSAERSRKFNEMTASWQAVQDWLNLNPPTPGSGPVGSANGPSGIDTGGSTWDPGPGWTPPTVDPGDVYGGIGDWGAGNKKVIGGMGGFGQ